MKTRGKIGRREFLGLIGAAALSSALPGPSGAEGGGEMYGLIGKMTAVEGRRDELIAILLEGVRDMPGCRSYVVAKASGEPDAIWITEVWESEEDHRASLSLPAVQRAIERGKPIIADFGERFVTTPVGGQGLV